MTFSLQPSAFNLSRPDMGLWNLIFNLGVNTSEFDRGLNSLPLKAAKAAAEMRNAMLGPLAGITSAAGFIAAIKGAIDYASHVKDLADQLNISTTAIQELNYAGKQTGTSLETFIQVLKKLAIARQEALKNPGGEHGAAFAEFGIGPGDLQSLRLEQLLAKIGQRFKAGGDTQDMLADSIKLIGKTAMEVFPALKEGIDDLSKRAHELGIIVGEENIRALEDYGDRWSEAGQKGKRAMMEIGSVIGNVHGQLAGAVDKIIAFSTYTTDLNSKSRSAGARERFDARVAEIEAAQNAARGVTRAGPANAPAGWKPRSLASIFAEDQPGDNATAKTNEQFSLKKILQLHEQIEQAKFRGLSTDEKRAKIEEKIAELGLRIKANPLLQFLGVSGPVDAMKLQLDRENALADLAGLKTPSVPSVREPRAASPDSLTSIGNFLGTDPSERVRSELVHLGEKLELIRESIDRGNTNTIRIQ